MEISCSIFLCFKFFLKSLVYKALKIFEIIKWFIYRGESYIDHRIYFFQCSEDIITDFFGGNFVFIYRPFCFEIIDNIFYFFSIYFSLGKSQQKRFFELLSVIHFFTAIFLYDHQFCKPLSFKSSKPMFTIFTFSSSSDTLTIFNHSRIDDFGLHTLTFWALHFYFRMKR